MLFHNAFSSPTTWIPTLTPRVWSLEPQHRHHEGILLQVHILRSQRRKSEIPGPRILQFHTPFQLILMLSQFETYCPRWLTLLRPTVSEPPSPLSQDKNEDSVAFVLRGQVYRAWATCPRPQCWRGSKPALKTTLMCMGFYNLFKMDFQNKPVR